ncbi:hypothetical protein BH10PSE13_BH10PSE13_20590 [soil metagenome]
MTDSTLALARLRRSLERLEPRRAAVQADLFASGHQGIDATLGGGLARGRLHDVFAGEEDCGSGAGVAALLCLCAGAGESRPFLWLRTEAAQKKMGRLHATGLGELGIDPATLLLALVPDEAALLHAAAEATRCAGLGALLIECWGPMRRLDLTASRRLMLAAEASGVTVLLLRIAAEPQPGAADTRWRVTPAPSIALEADAPGAPMFDLELLRRRVGPPAGPWRVEWDRDRACFRDPIPGSPLSRPVLPLVAGGTVALDPAATLRRAG